MKKKYLYLLILFLLANRVNISFASQDSLTQLFSEIPSELLGFYTDDGTLEPSSARSMRIRQVAGAKDYLLVNTDGLEGFESEMQVRRYELKNGQTLILVAYEKGDSSDDLQAFSKIDGSWVDCSSSVLPSVPRELIATRTKAKIPTLPSADFNLEDCSVGTYRYVLPLHSSAEPIKAIVHSDCVQTNGTIELFSLLPRDNNFEVQ